MGDPESEAWNKLPWRKFEQHVYRIQKRIYRASQRGNDKNSSEATKTLDEIRGSPASGSATGDTG